ncbi:hypothetical protein VNI00_010617 [Paramarasmius palmivorus]|uniref:Cytochrome P450 n=1 Tax=Paramarasmius palmivorus TaxID=297713 RepID=A0AAW0CGT9_9AGAR
MLNVEHIWIAYAFLLGLIGQAAVRKIYSVIVAFRTLGACPGRYPILFSPHLLTTNAMAPYFPFRGWFGHYFTTFDFYARHGSTCLSSVVLSDSTPVYWFSDAEAFKVVSTEIGVLYEKDMVLYDSSTGPGFNFLGDNIVGSCGKAWKRHRMIANPAFSESNISLVWRETIRILNEWTSALQQSTENGSTELKIFNTLKHVTTMVFTSAAFGKHCAWSESAVASKQDVVDLLSTAERLYMAKILLPEWIYIFAGMVHIPGLSPLLDLTQRTYRALDDQIRELISASRADLLDERTMDRSEGALLRAFVKANMVFQEDSPGSKDQRRHLTDQELLADMFAFLLAGQETAAATTSMALAYIALYPELQDRVFHEVCQVWPAGPPQEVDEMDNRTTYPRLKYTTAFVNETLRHFPAGSRLGRVVLRDTALPAQRFYRDSEGLYKTQPYSVPITKGSKILLDFGALHMNPLYWGDDAVDFNPDKFIDTDSYRWPREAFMAFSHGPRNCIGQRFAMTEVVCILAYITRKYRVVVPDGLAGKPEVLLEWKPQTANVPLNARVKLCPR